MSLRVTEAAMFGGVIGVFLLLCATWVALSYDWMVLFCFCLSGGLTTMIAIERLAREYWRKMHERLDCEDQIMRRWLMGWIDEAQAIKELDAVRRKF